MHYSTLQIIFIVLTFVLAIDSPNAFDEEVDVISYNATIEPDIDKKFIKGKVTIHFKINSDEKQVILNSGDLQIDHVSGKNVVGFRQNDHRVTIALSRRENENEITIDYHGNPSRGLLFNPELDHAYTVFSTSQWMVCVDSPSDKAKLVLNLLVPNDKTCIANGTLSEKSAKTGKTLYSWRQDYESPTYTYGFVIGNFNTWEEKSERISFRYFSKDHPPNELKTIFRETKSIMSFLENTSGVRYDQPTYSQILIGDHYQEMSQFAVLKNSYGELILKDSTEVNLITHELAHQWWGNQITCKSWNHFWLNEAFATYMSAAYSEHRFGKEKYNAHISSYFDVYQAIKKRGNDKSLVFKDWLNPSKDDRNLVYFKGAYVLHLLRQEMKDEAFWNGIKFYSRKYFGKPVETEDLQRAMEESSGKDLDVFFDEWIYNKRN